jgi:hypothetical protein
MIGQQHSVAGSVLRRVLLVLAVAAVMAATMVASAVPAFAALGSNGCRTGDTLVSSGPGSNFADKNADGLVCQTVRGGKTTFYDNRP